MKTLDLIFIIYYAFCTLSVLIYSIVEMSRCWKEKDKDDFKNAILAFVISLTPLVLLFVTVYLIAVPFMLISDWFDSYLDKKFKRK